MNGKRAKQLRRRAEDVTIGQPTVGYRVTHKASLGVGYVRQIQGGTVELAPQCTRAVYQRSKLLRIPCTR